METGFLMQRTSKFGLMAAALFGLGACSPSLAKDCPAGFTGFDPIPVQQQTLSAHPDGFGQLQFRSLINLTSDAARFGGLSGIDLLCDRRFVLVTDRGNLLTINFTEDANGQIILDNTAQIATLRDQDGIAIARKKGGKNSDAESLDWDDNNLLVAFEHNHRILKFDLLADGAAARARLVYDAPDLGGHRNHGMESLARGQNGRIITALERNVNNGAPLAISPSDKRLSFANRKLPLVGKTRPTGFAVLPASNAHPQILFSVHRDWNNELKNRNTIRIAITDLGKDGSFPEPAMTKVISTFHQASSEKFSNNFEGIAVRKLANNDARIYLITDNNFDPSGRQPSLLLSLDIPAKLLKFDQ